MSQCMKHTKNAEFLFLTGSGYVSLDKAIRHGKEKRKPYRGAKAVDKTCRNHGGCPYCESARLHSLRKRIVNTDQKMTEFTMKENSK